MASVPDTGHVGQHGSVQADPHVPGSDLYFVDQSGSDAGNLVDPAVRYDPGANALSVSMRRTAAALFVSGSLAGNRHASG